MAAETDLVTCITHFQIDDRQNGHQDEHDEGQRRGITEVGLAHVTDEAGTHSQRALWNQHDLVAERDKYGANDVMPGLTGWAQINGRDELEIPVKAKLDGEYVEKMSFGFDVKCFLGTITSVLKSEGVVEGGTGAMEKENAEQ